MPAHPFWSLRGNRTPPADWRLAPTLDASSHASRQPGRLPRRPQAGPADGARDIPHHRCAQNQYRDSRCSTGDLDGPHGLRADLLHWLRSDCGQGFPTTATDPRWIESSRGAVTTAATPGGGLKVLHHAKALLLVADPTAELVIGSLNWTTSSTRSAECSCHSPPRPHSLRTSSASSTACSARLRSSRRSSHPAPSRRPLPAKLARRQPPSEMPAAGMPARHRCAGPAGRCCRG